MKVILFAHGEVGFAVAKFIIDRYQHDLVAIVVVEVNQISLYAKSRNITVYLYDKFIDNSALMSSELEYGILAWWPFLIDSRLLTIPKFGFINTHPSLLPFNRGKNPNFWTLVNGDPYGVTIHKVTSGIDDGEILAQEEIDYDWCDNGGTLYRLGQARMVDLFSRVYPNLRCNNITSKPQGDFGSIHYGSQLHRASEINLDKLYLAKDILNLLRARTFPGFPGCWFKVSNGDGEERYEVTVNIRRLE